MSLTSKPTGFDAERAALETAVLNALKASTGTLPFPVIAESRPAVGVVAGKPWARVTVRPGTVSAAEIGTEMRRNAGLVIVQIFLPRDTGTQLALQTADALDALNFTSVDLPGGVGSLDFGCVSSVPIGIDQATSLMQINASLPYTRDVFVPVVPPVFTYPDGALLTEGGDYLVTETGGALTYV